MPAQQMDPPHGKARVPFFVPLFNPIARRMLRGGVPLGPNALLTVRGRSSGIDRTTPVAIVAIGGRRWVIATFGEVNWAKNLRAAGAATLTVNRRPEAIAARELPKVEAAAFFRDILTPYVSHLPLGRWMLGTMLGAREIFTDPESAALGHPVFEVRPRASGGSDATAVRPA
ncbi:MAG: nitroreductase family deazaflavin-dependent oxidoreductase [Candidatus Dormibacteraeota bacterium]|nr:nitroreductase family deazaflavin-dependent oxidoreductase [Candidatus Dormibacteraeota bacterium]